jgi:hypothetical protein
MDFHSSIWVHFISFYFRFYPTMNVTCRKSIILTKPCLQLQNLLAKASGTLRYQLHPLTMHCPAENGDDSDSDEELEMGGVTQKFLCPISLTPLVKPVTSLVSSVIVLTIRSLTFVQQSMWTQFQQRCNHVDVQKSCHTGKVPCCWVQ